MSQPPVSPARAVSSSGTGRKSWHQHFGIGPLMPRPTTATAPAGTHRRWPGKCPPRPYTDGADQTDTTAPTAPTTSRRDIPVTAPRTLSTSCTLLLILISTHPCMFGRILNSGQTAGAGPSASCSQPPTGAPPKPYPAVVHGQSGPTRRPRLRHFQQVGHVSTASAGSLQILLRSTPSRSAAPSLPRWRASPGTSSPHWTIYSAERSMR